AVRRGRPSSRPRRWCSPAAASRPTRACVPRTWAPTGTWPGCGARPTTPATGSRWRWRPERSPTQPYGHWSGCHAVFWDAGAPPAGDWELTNRLSKLSYPVGIVVNAAGRRFLDEGADFRNYTYARYGAEVLRQPGAVAYQLFDA